jgi:hypothetical protein
MRTTLVLASALILGACNMAADAQEGPAGGGQRSQRSFDLAGFDAVSLAGPHDVIVTVGPAHSVRAEGDAETLGRLKIEVQGSSLKIGMERGNWPDGWKRDRPKTTIYVTLPAIRAAAIAGSGDMRVDRVETNRFAGSIAGSGDLRIASLRATDADFSIAGSGGITAAGSASSTDISVAGSGDVNLEGFETRTAAVSVVGSGDVRARAMESASVSIMGSGDVTLTGTARCSVNKRGSGSVNCGG